MAMASHNSFKYSAWFITPGTLTTLFVLLFFSFELSDVVPRQKEMSDNPFSSTRKIIFSSDHQVEKSSLPLDIAIPILRSK